MKGQRIRGSNIVGLGALGQAMRTFVEADAKVVLFCVKAFDLYDALHEHLPLWPTDIPFVTLSNGYLGSIYERIKPRLEGRPLRFGVTTLGAKFELDGHLKVISNGATTIWGPWDASVLAQPTEAEISLCQKNQGWSWSDDMRASSRKKWIYNTTINTLCGALRLATNGQLVHHKVLAESVFSEAFALSCELWPGHVMGQSEDELRDGLWTLVRQSAENENSMMRDVRLGRKTESPFMAGLAAGRKGYDKLKTYHSILARFG